MTGKSNNFNYKLSNKGFGAPLCYNPTSACPLLSRSSTEYIPQIQCTQVVGPHHRDRRQRPHTFISISWHEFSASSEFGGPRENILCAMRFAKPRDRTSTHPTNGLFPGDWGATTCNNACALAQPSYIWSLYETQPERHVFRSKNVLFARLQHSEHGVLSRRRMVRHSSRT